MDDLEPGSGQPPVETGSGSQDIYRGLGNDSPAGGASPSEVVPPAPDAAAAREQAPTEVPAVASETPTPEADAPIPETAERDKAKAEVRAHAEDAYQEVATLFDKAGDHEQATKLREQAAEAGEQAAVQYEADRPKVAAAKEQISAMVAETILNYKSGRPYSSDTLGLKLRDSATGEIVNYVYSLLGLKRSDEPISKTTNVKEFDTSNGEFRVLEMVSGSNASVIPNRVLINIIKIGDRPRSETTDSQTSTDNG